MTIMFGFSMIPPCWVIIFNWFIGFDHLNADFGCAAVTGFMSLLFCFSTVFDSFQIFLS